jgi:hypothetical protein
MTNNFHDILVNALLSMSTASDRVYDNRSLKVLM